MTDYRDRLEMAAERGNRIGAAALLERIETAPVEPDHPAGAVSPRRGLVIAAAVFILVLAVGIALGIAFRPEPDVADVPEVELLLSHRELGGPQGPFAAGPGGFVRTAGERFEFSPDGVTWTAFDLPRGVNDDRPLQNVDFLAPQATNDTWMIEAVEMGRERVWVSSDGQTWTLAQWDETLASTMDMIIATGPGFFGLARPGDEPIEFWWSADGVTWIPLEVPTGVDRRGFLGPAISRAGISWFSKGGGGILQMIHSSDGVSWAESDIDVTAVAAEPDELGPVALNRIGGRWIFVANLRSTVGMTDEWTAQVWTSDDFVDWKYQGVPTFSVGTERPRGPGVVLDIGELLLSAPFTRGGPGGRTWTGELWVTRDGATWTQIAEGLGELQYLDGRMNADGTHTVLYAP